ncbi:MULTISPECIES: hypothetical protein [unclassified Sphingomonas]|uniref:hypothetical protein n=1 Tax=unclassified Sphingomonas TaxID=196159 RepID=UPI0006F2E33D|nr:MULTISPECIES: hypothetical protein [unclassified Sphingomonas]KQX18417.1 hypothetical protein ASD17_14745 [Sphingomonas sp. Root1294]KQY72258.1 hypothetical protein ASD39_20230 [Sphingomonas sp. Root50]KRB94471.1 hypothetical protein ASE22_00520 [Sphingomonas sp. Root720]
MSLLGGGIAAIFGAALGGLYLDGQLVRSSAGPIYDGEGNITGYAGGDPIAIKCQIDAASWAMRQSEGFVDGDMRIIVLTAGLASTITTEQRITVSGATWLIQSVELDAAASHYVLRGRKA